MRKQSAPRGQNRAIGGLMAAEIRTSDWRGRRCHPRHHLVWLSRSLRGRGRQFHRQEGGGPDDEGPYR